NTETKIRTSRLLAESAARSGSAPIHGGHNFDDKPRNTALTNPAAHAGSREPKQGNEKRIVRMLGGPSKFQSVNGRSIVAAKPKRVQGRKGRPQLPKKGRGPGRRPKAEVGEMHAMGAREPNGHEERAGSEEME